MGMIASTEALDALKNIGLNLYERKIFVALLTKGVATAAEISEIANVPRSRSYDVLESLAEKGFVMAQPSKPIKYVALKPADALERVKENLNIGHKEMIDRIDKLKGSSVLAELEKIYSKTFSLIQPTDMTGTLKGKTAINRQLQAIFKEAKKSIKIMTTEEGLSDLYSNHFRTLKKLARAGVKLKILAPLTNTGTVSALNEIAELRNITSAMGRVLTVDNDNIVLALTDDKKVHETQDVIFWAKSDHASKGIIQPFFDQVWSSAKAGGK